MIKATLSLLAFVCFTVAASPQSIDGAIASTDAHLEVSSVHDLPKNEFTERQDVSLLRVPKLNPAIGKVREGMFGVDYVSNNNGTCDHGVHLMWSTQLGSSVFATPRIVDLHSDGNKEILVPTYTQYVEALNAVTGEDVAGFPFAHPHFKSLCSPLPVDLNGDGILEWMIATYTGELLFLQEDGRAVKTIKVPPLPLKKDWRKRRNGNHSTAEKSMPPANIVNIKFERLARQGKAIEVGPIRGRPVRNIKATDLPQPPAAQATIPPMPGRRLAQATGSDAENDDDASVGTQAYNDDYEGDDEDPEYHGGYNDYLKDVYGENPYDDSDEREERLAQTTIGVDGWLSAEAKESMDLVFHPELYESSLNVAPEHDAFHATNMQSESVVVVASDEIAVDAHLLATPVVVDMDGDGTLDVIMHVSYFFDAEYYSRMENQNALPEDIAIDDYVADAVVCMDIVTGKVHWLQLLHVTPRAVPDPAYGLSSPVVINVNGDFLFDVFVTTSLGFVFGFNGRGVPLPGWPVTMAPILSSVIVEDIDGDGNVDICTGDIKGTVACFHSNGKIIWERQVAGAVSDTPTAGDVNGDGIVDIVVGTAAGAVYAIDGRLGKVLPFFPILTEGPILAPCLLVNLNNTYPPALPEAGKGLHICVPSHDGFLYIISGATGCYEVLDIDEKSSAMVLADDLTNNGMLDLIVTTLSGTVMVFATETPFHPLKAWPSRTKALNGATASEGHVGVFIAEESRQPHDVRGDRFRMLVTIVDERAGKNHKFAPRYILTVLIGTKVIVFSGIFFEAKTYTLELHAPLERVYANVRVVLSLPNGQHYEDMVAMSFNMHFLETIKYLLLGPFVVVMLALSYVRKEHTIKMTQYMSYQYARQRAAYYDDY